MGVKKSRTTRLKMVVRVDFSIIFDGFDEGGVGRFARAERVAIRHVAFIFAVAETCAESKSFIFGVENLRLREVECIVGVKKFFEAVDVIVHDEVNSEGFGNNVYFYGHNKQILRLFFYTQSYEKYMRKSL